MKQHTVTVLYTTEFSVGYYITRKYLINVKSRCIVGIMKYIRLERGHWAGLGIDEKRIHKYCGISLKRQRRQEYNICMLGRQVTRMGSQ